MINGFQKHFESYRKYGMDYLRQNVPEIKRLESLEELHDLRLIK